MMTASLFEDFSRQKAPPDPVPEPVATAQDHAENERARFDEAYNQGWSDGADSVTDEQNRINADIALALQEAGFAYFEARQHVLNSMKPLISEIVQSVLPRLAHDTIAPRIVEMVQQLAQSTEPPIRVYCSPEIEPALSRLVSEQISFPVEVHVEPTLSSSQAVLRYDEGETRVDLAALIDQISDAVSEFYGDTKDRERLSA